MRLKRLLTALAAGGAIALGAVLAGKIGGAPKTIGVVLSGGNISVEDYIRLLAA